MSDPWTDDDDDDDGAEDLDTTDDDESGKEAGGDLPADPRAARILRGDFGIAALRPGQKQVIDAALAGRDVFAVIPTAGGKSLCYLLPAVVSPGLTIIVTPSISLMNDQEGEMHALGICAWALHSNVTEMDQRDIRWDVASPHGATLILMISPEGLMTDASWRMLDATQVPPHPGIARFVVDETHNVAVLGNDYRPDYLGLGALRQRYPRVPIMALTATADERVEQAVTATLGLRPDTVRVRLSINRPNLHYSVVPKKSTRTKSSAEDIYKLLDAQRLLKSTGIIYCFSRRDCESLAADLNALHTRSRTPLAGVYHAGVQDRRAVEQAWKAGVTKIVCATTAFGEGINKPDVRFVIHSTLPRSMTAYVQESGRAGRDGLPAQCVVFYNCGDAEKVKKLVTDTWSTNQERAERGYDAVAPEVRAKAGEDVEIVNAYCIDTLTCRRIMIMERLGEHFDRRECRGGCDNCKRLKGQGASSSSSASSRPKTLKDYWAASAAADAGDNKKIGITKRGRGK